ncbi:A24 family peptidase [uncultured Mycolicibacterium sp.]|uniref:prepilin peptidase n=1 Tax=uncultured Mycolicibacterium sp. TaxID=2320817 RepID=UPI00262D7B48|nr:A24 family peptidase [uncultured Mycolicibacterium sp.]
MGVVLLAAVLAWFAALTVWDIRRRRLPDALTLPGAAAVLAGAALTGHGPAALLGGAGLGLLYLLVSLARPGALGGGDVKLAVGTGALAGICGPHAWLFAALAAPLFTAGWAVVALVRRAGPTVPHGPAMCAATALVLVPVLL